MASLNVPSKYQHMFKKLEINPDWYEANKFAGTNEEDKYILYFADGYAWHGEYPIMFVKSKKEAIEILKEGELEKEA